MSSAAGATDARISSDWLMIGNGSTPASAMRPANTETQLGAPSRRARAMTSTWLGVISAVTLTLIPASDSSRTSGASDSPVDVVTGTFT